MEKLVIIGSGCAGLSAAIYASRAGLAPVLIEGENSGGQIVSTDLIENYAGTNGGISGVQLIMNMRAQAENFGARFVSAAVKKVDFSSDIKKIFCTDKIFEAQNVIVATGASPKLTGAKNEKLLYGKGVSICATCDGAFYKGKNVAVIGGGDTAFTEALSLAKFASSVKIIHRRDAFRASKIMVERAQKNPKISFVLDSAAEEFLLAPNEKFAGIKIRNLKTDDLSELAFDGVFIAIGHSPNTAIFKGQLALDKDGFVKSYGKFSTQTSAKNVYAAGDCMDKKFRQAIVASALGCMAVLEILSKEN